MPENTTTWKRFYFEGNLAWKWIENIDDWNWLKHQYQGQGFKTTTTELLLSAKNLPGSERSFGFYSEYRGEKTLRDFMVENEMLVLIETV